MTLADFDDATTVVPTHITCHLDEYAPGLTLTMLRFDGLMPAIDGVTTAHVIAAGPIAVAVILSLLLDTLDDARTSDDPVRVAFAAETDLHLRALQPDRPTLIPPPPTA